jgi:hypothetical protein
MPGTSPRSVVCGLVVVVMVSGCGGDDPGSVITVRDSLGVEIIEVARDQVGDGWTVDPTPEWILGDGGAITGDLTLHRVVGARDLGEDIVVIAEAGTQQVLWIDVTSGVIRRWGGVGDGPEELRGLVGVFSVGGNRVGVYDRARRRYLEVDSSGELVREMPVPPLSDAPESPILVLAGEGESSPVIYAAQFTGIPRVPTDGAYRGSGPVVILGEEMAPVTSIRGHESFAGAGFAGAVLFGRTTLLAGSPSGLWIGDTEHPSVSLWSDGSGPLRVVRWRSAESRELTEEGREQFWDRAEPRMRPEERPMLDQLRSVALFAEQAPAFGSLLATPSDQLWIGEFVSPEYQMFELPPPAQEWLVVDLEEGVAGRVVTPEGLTVMQVGDGFVIGVHRDGLGAETVRRYQLRLIP